MLSFCFLQRDGSRGAITRLLIFPSISNDLSATPSYILLITYQAPFIPRPDGFNDEINNYLAFGHPGLAQEAFVELNRDLQRQVHQLPVFRGEPKADNFMFEFRRQSVT
jgi:hypothetical protein